MRTVSYERRRDPFHRRRCGVVACASWEVTMGAIMRDDEQQAAENRLAETIRETLAPHLGARRELLLEEITGAMVRALRGQFSIFVRRPRPRRETPRALSMRLPAVGVETTMTRKGRVFVLRVVSEHIVECTCNGEVGRYESLKAVATAICGYAPSVGGWQFFFGSMSREEVSMRYGTLELG